ncbi:hypothetical protein JI667_00610 [Bacillus sp. NTK074B]|nr:hypothetical protein [Bacillus sp. NTK074B]
MIFVFNRCNTGYALTHVKHFTNSFSSAIL